MATAWRIVKRRHAARALEGDGARLYGGRWNPPGVRVAYLAESRALALLEVLVHLGESAALAGFVALGVEVDSRRLERVEESALPARWWSSPAPAALQALGAEWLASRRSLWLSVPSAIVPAERILLLNPEHPAAARLAAGEPEAFRLDPRLSRQAGLPAPEGA
jgi:RES domain-containing protein